MLYDPKWEKPSLEVLIGWLETKNPRTKYDYGNCVGQCLFGQFVNAIGLEWSEDGSGPGWKYFVSSASYDLRMVSVPKPHTFGAALKRAREALEKQRVLETA